MSEPLAVETTGLTKRYRSTTAFFRTAASAYRPAASRLSSGPTGRGRPHSCRSWPDCGTRVMAKPSYSAWRRPRTPPFSPMSGSWPRRFRCTGGSPPRTTSASVPISTRAGTQSRRGRVSTAWRSRWTSRSARCRGATGPGRPGPGFGQAAEGAAARRAGRRGRSTGSPPLSGFPGRSGRRRIDGAAPSHLVNDLERVCDHVVLLTRAQPELCGDIDEILAEHRILTGPRRDATGVQRDHTVVEITDTPRETTMLVRLRGPLLDPTWEVHPVGLEELILAYMSKTAPPPGRGLHAVGATR